MSSEKELTTLPVAPLKLIVMQSCAELGKKVDDYIVQFRTEAHNEHKEGIEFKGYLEDSYIIDSVCPRFGTGEAKGQILGSVRGTDLYILTDVCNHSITYDVFGHTNYMSPDNHFQDLKRIIAAAGSHCKRITVIMPFLYESRQHKRSKLESLDAALALQELTKMGVSNIITCDAPDPRVNNSIPLRGFDNFQPPYQFIKAITKKFKDITIDKEHLMIISPDEGAMSRAVYFSSVLGVELGMFYKRRDYAHVVNGKNPIVAHEFLGADVTGKDVLVIDDMISSGESILDTAASLKQRGCRRVFVCTTFGLFTDGMAKFDEYYNKGYISGVVTTNLTYISDNIKAKPYFIEADMSKFLAKIIDALNHDKSIGGLMDPTERIHELIDKYNQECKLEYENECK